MNLTLNCRSNHQRCSLKKGALRNFAKFTGKDLRQSLLTCNFIKKETMTQVFSFKFCETFVTSVVSRIYAVDKVTSVVQLLVQSQKQPPECSVKIGVLRNLANFTGKHLCQSLSFNKVAGLTPGALLKNRLCQRCFPVKFEKFLRTPFLQNTSGGCF